MLRNYLNITEEELDKPIYRVFSHKRFFEMIEKNDITLLQPSKWQDPFENFILNATGELKNGLKFTVEFKNNFYGQCWTTKRESDAIWRIYSPEPHTNGIKVKTTIRKLFNALYEKVGEHRKVSCFIGKVKYMNKKNLLSQLSDSNLADKLTDNTGLGQASTLLFKRFAFSHEKEIRIIYYSPTNLNSESFKFKFDPNSLFDQIVFDPRMNYKAYKNDKQRLKEEFGLNMSIFKSSLYKIPELSFKME